MNNTTIITEDNISVIIMIMILIMMMKMITSLPRCDNKENSGRNS